MAVVILYAYCTVILWCHRINGGMPTSPFISTSSFFHPLSSHFIPWFFFTPSSLYLVFIPTSLFSLSHLYTYLPVLLFHLYTYLPGLLSIISVYLTPWSPLLSHLYTYLSFSPSILSLYLSPWSPLYLVFILTSMVSSLSLSLCHLYTYLPGLSYCFPNVFTHVAFHVSAFVFFTVRIFKMFLLKNRHLHFA